MGLLHVSCTVITINSDEDKMTKTVRYVGNSVGNRSCKA